jgi:hypothetical protein
MVQMLSLTALCSSLVGLSSAAALGTAEEYADGSVHALIMGMKMVRTLAYGFEAELTPLAG